MSSYVKDPDDALPYAVDWTPLIATLDGDTINGNAIIASADLTIDNEGVTADVHTMVIAGGTPGERYVVTSRVTTVAGVTKDQSFVLWITEV